MPQIALDKEATALAEARAHEIFDGVLPVRMQGHLPNFAPWEWYGSDIRVGFSSYAPGI